MSLIVVFTNFLAKHLLSTRFATAIVGNSAGLLASKATSLTLQYYGVDRTSRLFAGQAVGSICSHSVKNALRSNYPNSDANILGEIPISKIDIPLDVTTYDSPIVFGKWGRSRFSPLTYGDTLLEGTVIGDSILGGTIKTDTIM